jgi:hypothetical protein
LKLLKNEIGKKSVKTVKKVGRVGRPLFPMTYIPSHWEDSGKEVGRVGRDCA